MGLFLSVKIITEMSFFFFNYKNNFCVEKAFMAHQRLYTQFITLNSILKLGEYSRIMKYLRSAKRFRHPVSVNLNECCVGFYHLSSFGEKNTLPFMYYFCAVVSVCGLLCKRLLVPFHECGIAILYLIAET